MSTPELDQLRRQYAAIMYASANTFRACALVVEQYGRILEGEGLPSPHDIAQLASQLPQISPMTHGKGKKSKDKDGDLRMFDPLPDEDGDSKKRKRGPKKPRDPNAPKRPPSAYLLYQNAVRAKVKAEHPDMPYSEILGQISKQWSELEEAEKKTYVDATAIAKEQFEGEKAKYEAQLAAGVGAGADTSIAHLASPTEESDAESPAAVVVPSKSHKSKPAEKATAAKSPPKGKKKAAPVVQEPSESLSGDEDSSKDSGEDSDEDVVERPKKKAKRVKTPSPPPQPAKKEKKSKEEKSSKKK